MSAVLDTFQRHRVSGGEAVRTKRTSEHLDRLIIAALTNGPLTINKVAKATGLSNWTTHYHIKIMCRDGVLVQLASIRAGRGQSIVVGLPGQQLAGEPAPSKPCKSGVTAPAPYATGYRWGAVF